MVNSCPFQPKTGYVDARCEYLYHVHGIQTDNDAGAMEAYLPTANREASTDPDDPLYFWQLYSLIGHEPVVELVSKFYDRVYADTTNPWFLKVFQQAASKKHHINAQAAYWIDAFGGGRIYPGANSRLTFHHHHNAGEIMTAKGAKKWMTYMRAALRELQPKFDKMDRRVVPCLLKFLEIKMKTYADDHGWDFDENDFASLARSNEIVTSANEVEKAVESMSVSELKAELRTYGIPTNNFLEKDDLTNAVRNARESRQSDEIFV